MFQGKKYHSIEKCNISSMYMYWIYHNFTTTRRNAIVGLNFILNYSNVTLSLFYFIEEKEKFGSMTNTPTQYCTLLQDKEVPHNRVLDSEVQITSVYIIYLYQEERNFMTPTMLRKEKITIFVITCVYKCIIKFKMKPCS